MHPMQTSTAAPSASQPQRPSSRPARPLSSSRHSANGSHARSSQFPRADTPTYKPLRYLGRGSFGVVLLAENTRTGEKVAIKRVRYDPRLHNREVAILNTVLVDPKTTTKANAFSRSEVTPGSSPAAPFVEHSVQDWAGIHHPNIVELVDFYVTYDSSPAEADPTVAAAAAAAAFHAQMSGAGGHQRDKEFLTQMRQSGYPMPDFGGLGVAGAANAYLEMVMSYLPMDLYALKKYFYRYHLMPTAEPSVSRASSSEAAGPAGPAAAAASVREDGATEPEEEGRVPPLSASPPHTAGRPISPKTGARMPLRWIKILLFQLARALAFMHANHVCHRDLKPANVLVDPCTGRLQLCDFGSAKQILCPTTEKNVSYICSRYYRAPELLFGALHYGCEVDMWSYGCLLAELLRESGRPLFHGCTSVDQMAELFKVMGAPSKREMYAMNPQCAEALLRTHAMQKLPSMTARGFGVEDGISTHHDGFLEEEEEAEEADVDVLESTQHSTAAHHSHHHRHRDGCDDDGDRAEHLSAADEAPTSFTEYYDVLKVRAIPWKALFPVDTPNEAVALVTGLLCYAPQKRLSALEVVEHPFFDDLFAPTCAEDEKAAMVDDFSLRMPNGRLMPLAMFQITEMERGLFTEAFVAKMGRQATLLAAALKKEEDQTSS